MEKQNYINAFICAVRRFASAHDFGRDRIQIANEIEILSETIVEMFDVDWDELDAIEASVFAQF